VEVATAGEVAVADITVQQSAWNNEPTTTAENTHKQTEGDGD
jgi:hypothetical protein